MSDYVIASRTQNALSLSTLHRHFAKHCEEAGLPRLRIHDLRHTAIVLALENGASLEDASQGAGHTGIEITKRVYAPKVTKYMRGFANALDNALAK
jgi:integrase